MPRTPEATAKAIEVCNQAGAYVAFHCGTKATSSNLEGLREVPDLVGNGRLHVAHVNAYCRGMILSHGDECNVGHLHRSIDKLAPVQLLRMLAGLLHKEGQTTAQDRQAVRTLCELIERRDVESLMEVEDAARHLRDRGNELISFWIFRITHGAWFSSMLLIRAVR